MLDVQGGVAVHSAVDTPRGLEKRPRALGGQIKCSLVARLAKATEHRLAKA